MLCLRSDNQEEFLIVLPTEMSRRCTLRCRCIKKNSNVMVQRCLCCSVSFSNLVFFSLLILLDIVCIVHFDYSASEVVLWTLLLAYYVSIFQLLVLSIYQRRYTPRCLDVQFSFVHSGAYGDSVSMAFLIAEPLLPRDINNDEPRVPV